VKEIIQQDVLSLKDASRHLDIPENVLKQWVELRFRHIPYHSAGSGKKAGYCFFKTELEDWFDRNGGQYLRNKVVEKKDGAGYKKKYVIKK
jgi:hypothetical protein